MRGEDLRAVMRRFPTGVAVVTLEAEGVHLGLTLGSLVTLSLEPPLVGFAVARTAAAHELLREAGRFGISLLAAGQEPLAQHFARGVPPIGMWEGIALEDDETPRLLAGALGWLRAEVRGELDAGTHTFFSGEVTEARRGGSEAPLLRLEGAYRGA